MQILRKTASAALDFLLPPLCPATGEAVDAHGMVAPEYWSTLRFIRKPHCPKCAIPFPFDMEGEGLICAACLDAPPSFARARAALVYDDASRQLILRFKHGDQLQAIPTLAPWMETAGADVIASADIIMPVPLHRWRLLKRRYNQAALLAHWIGKTSGKYVAVDGLIRIKQTPPQGHLDRKDRVANVKGAFIINPKIDVKDKNILLIDDVMTTGATMNACADALLTAGVKSVDVLVAARAVRD
ncbi:MAG TPA: ComF family protein [Alphaproteobacteria bacterium]